MTQPPETASDARVGLAHRRTAMAMYRTQLALDRTTLAWLRTTLTMASFGFGLVAFFRALRQANASAETLRMHEGAIRFGTALVVLGLGATILAGVSHLVSLRSLSRGEAPKAGRWPLSVTVAFLSAVAGLAGLWSMLNR